MTHSHDDDSRQPPSADRADLDLRLVPEPLVPAEPPSPVVIEIEPSWRQILATQTPLVNEVGPRAPEAPAPDTAPGPGPGFAEPSGAGHVRPHDTTIGTLGDEPMGGVPHDAAIQE